MAGLAREAATRAAQLWKQEQRSAPTSYSAIRDWISQISESSWNSTSGAADLSGADLITIWDELHS